MFLLDVLSKQGEEEIFRGIYKTYGVVPTPLAMKMVKMCRRQLYRYYSEKLLTRCDIDATITLKTEEDIVRAECAKASLKYVYVVSSFSPSSSLGSLCF